MNRNMSNKTREELLEKMLLVIKKNPGIRPSELNHRLNLPHSWNLHSTLIIRGLIRKERDGAAIRYYPKHN